MTKFRKSKLFDSKVDTRISYSMKSTAHETAICHDSHNS
jgi:hypothetical protein